MTDRSKFEQMLEHLVNEDQEAAKEIFHQIVVEKSREIYENILAEDFDMDEAKDEEDEMDEAKDDEEEEESVEEAKDDEEDDEESMDEDFAFDEGDDDKGPVGGDPTDDMLGDIESGDGEGDDMDMGDEGSDDIVDRVDDLEDAMDELRAMFEKEFSGDDMGDDMGSDDMGDDMGSDDMDDEELPMKSYESDNFMREYIEKVGGATYDKFGKMGDDGANTKSVVAGKNDMGGTSANILGGRNGQDAGEAGAPGGQLKGNGVLKGKVQDMNTGNINVPGGKAGKSAFTKKEPGHGAEKKGAGEQADNKTSPLSGLKSRAK